MFKTYKLQFNSPFYLPSQTSEAWRDIIIAIHEIPKPYGFLDAYLNVTVKYFDFSWIPKFIKRPHTVKRFNIQQRVYTHEWKPVYQVFSSKQNTKQRYFDTSWYINPDNNKEDLQFTHWVLRLFGV